MLLILQQNKVSKRQPEFSIYYLNYNWRVLYDTYPNRGGTPVTGIFRSKHVIFRNDTTLTNVDISMFVGVFCFWEKGWKR